MRKALTHLRRSDPTMRDLIRRIGAYAIEYAPADFSTLVRCITYQQLSGKVASKIYARLEDAADRPLTPGAVLKLKPARMRAVGLSQRKIDYIRELATRCRNREVNLANLEELPDDEVMRSLTNLKGIGPWTVHMYLIFALRRPDVLRPPGPRVASVLPGGGDGAGDP